MKKLFLLLIVVVLCGRAFCQEQTDSISARNDSIARAALPTDLMASIVVADPGEDFYSSYGHCALRLCCPSLHKDFCYTYCLDENLKNEISMFTGTGKAAYYAIKTQTFVNDYIKDGRTVRNYPINLSVEQVRQLWQIIDSEVSGGENRQYNYLHTNCSSMTLFAVERCLGTDRIEWGNLDEGITGTYRNFVKSISSMCPWTGLFWTTILGSGGDELGEMEDKMGPVLLVPAMKNAKFVTEDGTERPFLAGEPELINKGNIVYSRGWFIPEVCFILLLIIAFLASFFELFGKCHIVVCVTDIAFMCAQTFCGIVIFYLSCISSMVGASGNINLLVLNPLPFILWLVFRKKKWYGRIWFVYSLAIIIYIALWTVSPQVDLVHVLMVMPLLVRCLTKAKINYNIHKN